MRRTFSGFAGLALAALPCFAVDGAQAADVAYAAPRPAVRTLTVQRVAVNCPPLPAAVARGRRGVGEPGTFYAYWDWEPVCVDHVVIGR
ncbi:MAG: hypothetical protein JWO64_2033 [Hyphomicrobiales bacterium]|nr:hypothetical protein [Hyphomicrobiales bacterium]